MPRLHMMLLTLVCLAPAVARAADAELRIIPVPRPVLTETLQQWAFEKGEDGWKAEHECEVSAAEGFLRIKSSGSDPFFHRLVDLPGGRLAVHLRIRSRAGGDGALYWTTDQSPQRGEDKVAHFSIRTDGQWHEAVARFVAAGRVTDLRIDPAFGPGEIEIDSVRVVREEPHPLTINEAKWVGSEVRFSVRNHRTQSLEFSAAGQSFRIDDGATISISRPVAGAAFIEPVSLELLAKDLPPVRRTVFLHHEKLSAAWRSLRGPKSTSGTADSPLSVQVAPDGSVARVRWGGRLVAFLGPLVHCDGRIPKLTLAEDAASLRFRGEGVSLALSITGKEIEVSIDSQQPCEGPVVRVLGGLEHGLFAGLEYLSKGETSSSKLDIETEEHLRFAPDPLKVTMPLMALVTDRASVAMTWDDMNLQPVYATPNFFDCADDHRMALRGTKIRATIRIAAPTGDGPLEETILWAVKKHGLPPLPAPPVGDCPDFRAAKMGLSPSGLRSKEQQWKLCLAALNGPLRTEAGWGHCVQENFARHPYSDMASTIWRLTGEAPNLPRLVLGGAHVSNVSIYFVTGRAQQWLDGQKAHAQALAQQQQPDGSYRYDGEYRRGHFEDTASGICAPRAAALLEYAYLTGDKAALEAGVRTLEYMKRFCVPRGAQTWEVPLHTPDILASAYLVTAYVRGYELTGKREYLAHARRWALSGVPFVYLWGRYPIMLYATTPVYGATFWRHSWFGLPVQWCGIDYAYALTKLAPHDQTLDWNHLARGILLSGEQQQYPDGPHVGLLPDSFALAAQRRQPADINPCALVSLRMVLDGELDSLAVAIDGPHRVIAPFPLTIRDGQAHLHAKAGVKYQVIIDGQRVVDVTSQGDDVVPLQVK